MFNPLFINYLRCYVKIKRNSITLKLSNIIFGNEHFIKCDIFMKIFKGCIFATFSFQLCAVSITIIICSKVIKIEIYI